MSWPKIEYLGWGAYCVFTALCGLPLAVLFFIYGSEEMQPLGLILAGLFAGAVAAAILTFAGNELLQRGLARREALALEAAEREQGEQKLARKLRRKEKKQQRAQRRQGKPDERGEAGS